MPDSVRAIALTVSGAAALGAAVVAMGFGVPPALALLVPLTLALGTWYWHDLLHELRQERRAKGQCVYCGYDVRRNVGGVCPKCGGGEGPWNTGPLPFAREGP